MRARERLAKEDGKEFRLTKHQIKVIHRAQAILGSSVHPDTGNIIPWWQRMSSFVFCQLPLSIGLTMATPTFGQTVFWHWATQSYYAGLNYGNRNATNISSTISIGLAYTAAAASSVFLAVTLRKILGGNAALKMRLGNQLILNSTTSFLAMAGAAAVNSLVMRSDELKNGIRLYNELNEPVGLSRIAAWQAVLQTSSTRLFLAFQTVFLPGVVIGVLNNRGYMPRGKIPRAVSEIGIMGVMLVVGLPMSIAFFSQEGKIKAKRVEKEFREVKRQGDGKRVEVYHFNRGL
ncbi:hypothetical protein FGO68_gene10871 [Halteria grandinella]|uniref:Sideroflexin 5 n=1 Tax=Halteria grandinella TaxID=5974 RepID=A0A8J8NCS7_HALGN|nr:hypothetical protein FGO68_gene10871 [Halteria grandinella]